MTFLAASTSSFLGDRSPRAENAPGSAVLCVYLVAQWPPGAAAAGAGSGAGPASPDLGWGGTMTVWLGDSRQAMEAGDCYQFRIALLGDAAVGKTSLLRRYVEGGPGTPEPEPESAPTVGVEFYSRALQLRAGPRVKLQLWDTAGQERFRCARWGRVWRV